MSHLYGSNLRVQQAAPATGGTVTIAKTNTQLLLEPAAPLLTLTVAFPTANLSDGDVIGMMCTFAVTTLTITSATIVGLALGSFTAGGFATWRYRSANASWYRIG